jgi:hypothetical protein
LLLENHALGDITVFSFGRRKGITDQEMWTLAIRVAVKMTVEEDMTKQPVEIPQSKEILQVECKTLRLRPTAEEQDLIITSVYALSSTELTHSLMDRWLKDRHITITPADIAAAGQLLEGSVQDYLSQRKKD